MDPKGMIQAIDKDDPQAVKAAVGAGFPIDQLYVWPENGRIATSLDHATRNQSFRAVDALMQLGAQTDVKGSDDPALVAAANLWNAYPSHTRLNLVVRLLEAGADPNNRN